jgi:hypothetical protein
MSHKVNTRWTNGIPPCPLAHRPATAARARRHGVKTPCISEFSTCTKGQQRPVKGGRAWRDRARTLEQGGSRATSRAAHSTRRFGRTWTSGKNFFRSRTGRLSPLTAALLRLHRARERPDADQVAENASVGVRILAH